MTRYIVRTFYEGRDYYGYQRQPYKKTVEGTIIEALIKVNYIKTPDENHFRSASRTDKHVNAIGNVFVFNTESKLSLNQLNAALPKNKSIVCWGFSKADKDFSPKYSKWKRYWYVLPLKSAVSISGMNVNKIKEVCSYFEGKNDFKLFCKVDHRDTKREIEKLNVFDKNDCLIFEVISNSFLWEQIRRIISYVLNYNTLTNELQNTKELLLPNTAIQTLNIEPADPNQLILVEHYYENIEWIIDGRAVNQIVKKMDGYIHSLKQKEKIVTSIYEFFNSDISK